MSKDTVRSNTGTGNVKPFAEINRFWAKVDKSNGPAACWNWTGCLSGSVQRYGCMRVNGPSGVQVRVRANRYAYELQNGSIKEGNVIMHLCDNPQCVNPSHLAQGTHTDNARDKVTKGRNRSGARIPRTIATRVRADFVYGLTIREIALRYDIASTSVQRITKGLYVPKPENGVKISVPRSFKTAIYR